MTINYQNLLIISILVFLATEIIKGFLSEKLNKFFILIPVILSIGMGLLLPILETKGVAVNNWKSYILSSFGYMAISSVLYKILKDMIFKKTIKDLIKNYIVDKFKSTKTTKTI